MAVVLFALAALQAASALKQADEIRRSADLTNQLNEINAKYADYDAYQTETFGQTEAARYQTTIDQTLGAQRAGYAAGNVDVNFGTAAEVQNETKLTGVLNIIDIQQQARMKAQGYRREARNIRSGMSVARSQAEMQANATVTAGLLNAGATGYRAYTQLGDDGLKPNVEGKANKIASNDIHNYNGRINSSGPRGYGPEGSYVESELAGKGHIGSIRKFYRMYG